MPVPQARNAGNSTAGYDESGRTSASTASPAAARTSPAVAGIRSPTRPMTRPAIGAITASGANNGTSATPASNGERCWTDCRKSVRTNSVPSVPRFIAPAARFATANRGRRIKSGGSIAASPRRRSTATNAASAATATTGMLFRNTARHPKSSTSAPPSSGPAGRARCTDH